MPGHRSERTILAERRNRHINQRWLAPPQLRRIEAETRHYAGAKAFHQCIGAVHECQKRSLAGRAFEVNGDRALVAVERLEMPAVAARRIAGAGAFDQNHISAEIRQQRRGIRTGVLLGEAEDADA